MLDCVSDALFNIYGFMFSSELPSFLRGMRIAWSMSLPLGRNPLSRCLNPDAAEELDAWPIANGSLCFDLFARTPCQ